MWRECEEGVCVEEDVGVFCVSDIGSGDLLVYLVTGGTTNSYGSLCL